MIVMKQACSLVWWRMTRCDSGKPLNFLMYPFLLITLAFGIGFVFFSGTDPIQASILYMETVNVGENYVNQWGLIATASIVLHTIGFLVRGRYGVYLMQASVFAGFYVWLWAAVIYFLGGFYFQIIVACLPNLMFWGWYTKQWHRRKTGKHTAFI